MVVCLHGYKQPDTKKSMHPSPLFAVADSADRDTPDWHKAASVYMVAALAPGFAVPAWQTMVRMSLRLWPAPADHSLSDGLGHVEDRDGALRVVSRALQALTHEGTVRLDLDAHRRMGLRTTLWGPLFWWFMHRLADDALADPHKFALAMAGVLPCASCSTKFRARLEVDLGPESGTSPAAWMARLHNFVSLEIGRPAVRIA
jgi:hypothetical protein